MNLGEIIQKERKKQKLSQEELGELMGVTRQTISNWESSESSPNITEAQKLAKIFNLSLDDLVGNKIENVLLKKINKTKSISIFSLGISLIHFILFLAIVILGIIMIFNYYQVEGVGKSVEMNCKLNNNIYNYKLDLDVKTDAITSFTTTDEELLKNFKYDTKEHYEEVMQRIKNEVIKRGGSCN